MPGNAPQPQKHRADGQGTVEMGKRSPPGGHRLSFQGSVEPVGINGEQARNRPASA